MSKIPEPTRPLFEIGEVVIICPLRVVEASRPYVGLETKILSRNWDIAFSVSKGVKQWQWGYKTEIGPKKDFFNGKKIKDACWAESSLRKKYDPGMDFEKLIKELNAPIEVEEVEYISCDQKAKANIL